MRYLWMVCILFLWSSQSSAQTDAQAGRENISIELNRNLKNKVIPERVDPTGDVIEQPATALLPYIKVQVVVRENDLPIYKVQLSDLHDQVIKTKKFKTSKIMEFNLGFEDDIKDGILPMNYRIELLTKQGESLHVINFRFESDGKFYINEKFVEKI